MVQRTALVTWRKAQFSDMTKLQQPWSAAVCPPGTNQCGWVWEAANESRKATGLPVTNWLAPE